MKTLLYDGIDLREYFFSRQVLHLIEKDNYNAFNQDENNKTKHYEIAWVRNLKELMKSKKPTPHREETEKEDIMIHYAIKINNWVVVPGDDVEQHPDKKSLAEFFNDKANDDLRYLEIYSVQQIIDFKWKTYTYVHYRKRFFIFIVFASALIFDLIFC